MWSGKDMKYQINSTGQVIMADLEFVTQHYPGDFTEVIETAPVVVDPCEWLIDVGPFFDRFGAAKLAVLTSADATVKAILQDIQVRKWIDLKRADVASSLAYVGTKVPAVDTTMQAAILNTPVSAADNLALRKMFFS